MLMLRSTHDALMAAKDAQLAAALEAVRVAQDQSLRVLDKYAALLEVKAAPSPPPPPRVKREPDATDTAIEWVAQGDVQKRRYLDRWVKAERAKGRAAGEIADEILRGATAGDDEDGVPG